MSPLTSLNEYRASPVTMNPNTVVMLRSLLADLDRNIAAARAEMRLDSVSEDTKARHARITQSIIQTVRTLIEPGLVE